MIYFNNKNKNESTYIANNVSPTFINGKRYGGNPKPSDFPSIEELLIDDNKIKFGLVYIPVSSKSDIKYNNGLEALDNEECYKLYIIDQMGTFDSDADTHVVVELPTGIKIPIVISCDGVVAFDPKSRFQALRDYKAEDRRIIRGFCIKYWTLIRRVAHGGLKDPNLLLELRIKAMYFRSGMIPKRLPKASRSSRPYNKNNLSEGYDFRKPDLGIFHSIRLI